MATYKIDRASSAQYTGKFKFDYQINLITDDLIGGFNNIFQVVSAGAYPSFFFKGVTCAMYIGELPETTRGGSASPKSHPWDGYDPIFQEQRGGNFGFGNFVDGQRNLAKIPITFFIQSFGGIEVNGGLDKDYSETVILYTETYNPTTMGNKIMSGSIEGEFFVGLETNEFVDIDEYYPSENYFIGSPVCPDNEDEFWRNKELTKDTVRQWPKYTSLNWYETINPESKAYVGLKIKFTNPKGQVTSFAKTFVIPNPELLDLEVENEKFINAWTTTSSNSGYVSISSNIPVEAGDQDFVKKDHSQADSQNYNLLPFPNATLIDLPKCTARIRLKSDSPRKVSFESKILDWKNAHTDPLTAYVVGFNSDGKNRKKFRNIDRTIPLPTYATINTNSGNVGLIEQTFRNYHGEIEVRESDGLLETLKVLDFNNQQKWIFGLVDTIKSKEPLDDLESPPKNYDFPIKFVRSATGCYDINETSRELTLDKYDFPGSVPIPLRGWKFNSMSLSQDKEFIIEGTGNVRFYNGSESEPHYYGDQNLSGYRYLEIELKSSGQLQSGNLLITETSKGPTLQSNSKNESVKSYKISTDSSSFKTLRIDLCNPDNKIDDVDNQDSPYPRLNTFTTSKPQSTSPIGYLSTENLPKDNFLITKPNRNTESLVWITDDIKQKIKNSGIVYLTDTKENIVDYFEVNTSAFPKTGIGTNVIFGKPRINNGKIKLAKPWNGGNLDTSRKELFIYIVKNDITSGKSIDELLNRGTDGKYPDEFEVYDFDPGLPDKSEVVSRTTFDFVDGSGIIYINPIPSYESSQVIPYDGIEVEDKVKNLVKSYKIIDYVNDVANTGKAYFTIQIPSDYNINNKFAAGSSIRLKFLDNFSDDKFASIIVKIDRVEKYQNFYRANIEYSKLDKNSPPDYEGIPRLVNNKDFILSANAPVITVKPVRLVEKTFPADTVLNTNLIFITPSGPEVNAIDDAPEDEASNGPYYGISRISKIEIDNDQLQLGKVKLVRNNSLSNFVTSGNNNTFVEKTKFQVSSDFETTYYTRRFWQQNTDARDEEEGDITWQNTVTPNLNTWTLSPKSISELCDDISKVDPYVNPRWLDPNNSEAKIIRHPGWKAKKVEKSYPVDPITGNRIYGIKLDPEYLNSDTGYSTWVYGNGLLAIPSGKNSGSGTSYINAINISFNDLQTILAQTIFHRINGDFPPGKPDLFGNSSLRNEDGTIQESTLHIRGGFIARGPGYGLILPPQISTPDNLRKANLLEASTRSNKGSSESDAKGYFETGSVYGKNKIDHYIELEKSKNFTTPSQFRSSTRNMSQAKRERAAYKGGKQNVATNLSACESGFEKSIIIAYTVPTTKPGEENQTAIISTDSFFNQQYEKYPVGYNTITGLGVTVKGEFPFVISSDKHINQRSRINTFLLTERNSNVNATSSHDYDSLIAANTDMRNKLSWFPYIDGQAKTDANFSTLAKAFKGTKYNSYVISDEAPQLFNVGYADPGAIVFRSISLNTTNIKEPVTDKTIFVDGIAPTYISDFRLIEPITSSGIAYSSFPTVVQISSRDYIVAYSLNASPRKINFKLISNYQAQERNTLFDLDAIAGNTLDEKYNIYGLTSDYDEKLGLHRSVFWCNGGIYYFEYGLSSSSLGKKRTDKLHLIKGKLDESLVSELINRQNIITYFETDSELNAEVPRQKPALITCKKQEYDGKVFVAYDTGKCFLEAVLFHPYSKILGIRKFDIECVNNSGSTVESLAPVANIQANPTSGQSALIVNFLSTNSYDPGGSTLTYAWNFGDNTQSTEENPAHTFVNNTTNAIEYKVTLIVTNASGVSSAPASIIITVNPAPVNNLSPQAKFSATPTSGDVTLTVTFTDQSNPANDGSFIQIYEWDFGDGNTAIKFDNTPFTYDYTRAGSFTPTLFVKDNLARLSSKYFGPTINVNGVVNNPPSPNFKWAQTSFSPTLKVQFTDTSSDDEGPLVAWNWNFGDNQTADVQNPEHIYANPGKYRVVLTVTDSGGLQVSGTIEITVLPPGNNPPIANFIYSQQNRKLVIDFVDTSTDADGTIASWNWDFDDGFTDNVQNPSHTYFSAGRYLVSLTVTDNGGKSTSITKEVIVNPLVNQAPVISNITGNQTSFKPLVVKFTETSSDPDGFITQWNWNFGDGKTFSTTDPTLKNPTNTYLFPGEYTVVLTVTDDGLPDGTNKKTATSSIKFTVVPPPVNQPPQALFVINSNNILAPATILFTDVSTDADGKIVSWFWEFETGSTLFLNAQTYQKNVSHTFTKSGTYPVKLTVTDDGNLTNTYVLDIIVKNNPPVAIITASPNPVLSKTQVNFFGNNSNDSDGNITKYAWNFGDGTIISQGRITEPHIYAKPGTYNASLTVTDNIGDTSTDNLLITVTNRNPVSRITYTSLSVKAPGSLTFNGDTSTDEDGIIVSYSWSIAGTIVASTPNATINFATEGSYTVSLTVTDDFGASNTASVSVNVTAPDNILPIAILNVDKNSGVINDTFVFDVSNSRDPDGSIILYRLDFGDGTSTQFVNPAPISHIYKTVGVFIAKLTATDNRSGVSLETVDSTKTIQINNQPPVANFSYSPIGAFTFDPITFIDNSSDPENSLVRWSWDFGDGTNFTTTDPLQKNPTKSYNDGNRNYTVTLTVFDNFGLSNTASKIVFINNRKPFAVISTSSTPVNNVIFGTAPFTVTFDSNSYDLDGTVVNYEWYINGLLGTPFRTKSFTYTFSTPRFIPYSVTLKVQDDDGAFSDLANIGVKVNAPNEPPVANIAANPSSNTSFAPVTVTFSAAGSYDPDNIGGPLIYAWDFGNGKISDQVIAATTYNNPGTYKVSLKVTDNLAATNTATLDYIVKNNKPIALLDTLPPGIVSIKINTPIVFTSFGSYDSDSNQFINGYKWLKDGVNQNSNTPTFETSFDSVGNHTITLSVFDNLGLESDPVNKTVFVFEDPVPPPPNQNPIAILGNEPTVTGYIELKVGDTFTFDGTNSYDPEDGSSITFEWSIDGVKSGYNSTFANQFNTVGIFTVSLVVFDTQKFASSPATNLGNRYTVDVNVSAIPNPLANKLFSSGQALYGAIASGSNSPNRYGFELVDDKKQYTIIESGLYHTFVVDADGKLYASGSNSNGQLGFPSNITQQNSLTLVPLASKFKVLKVSAGDFCSAIIAEDTTIGKRVLLVCGSNINGIFGQSLPRTNIYSFQPILERANNFSGASYTSNNGLLDVSCNSYILAFTDNKQVWVAGSHRYTPKTGIIDTGFFPINIDPNPDLLPGNTNYLNPFKLEVGFNNESGFVTGLSYDIDNQIVWFTGLSSLRGWGYAYDISTYENRLVVITASQNPFFDHAIYLYNFSASEVPQFDFSSGIVSDVFPGLDPPQNFLKVSTGKFGYLAVSEKLFFPYGLNDFGQLGYVQSIPSSTFLNIRDGIPSGLVLPNMSVQGISDIAAGGNHSIILASNVTPSSYSFTITRPGGYATDPQYPTAYPITAIDQ